MSEEITLSDVEFITIEAPGPPGERTFHLQAMQESRLVTVVLEKFQAAAIAENLLKLLDDLEKDHGINTPTPYPHSYDFALHEPIAPLFRVGQIGLGYAEDDDLIVLIVGELLPEEAPEEPRLVRLGINRPLVRALADHTESVVASGRKICGHCGKPIDPDGHFCPGSNGHRKH